MLTRFATIAFCALTLPVAAGPAMADALFGAIAFSPATGKVGGGWNYATKKEATSRAVSQCGADDCNTVVVFPNCGAVAVGDGYGMGYSADKSVAKSEETAIANCTGYTGNCLITMSFCNEGS